MQYLLCGLHTHGPNTRPIYLPALGCLFCFDRWDAYSHCLINSKIQLLLLPSFHITFLLIYCIFSRWLSHINHMPSVRQRRSPCWCISFNPQIQFPLSSTLPVLIELSPLPRTTSVGSLDSGVLLGLANGRHWQEVKGWEESRGQGINSTGSPPVGSLQSPPLKTTAPVRGHTATFSGSGNCPFGSGGDNNALILLVT